MKQIFKAFDGTTFDNEFDCVKYDFVHSDILIISDKGDIVDKQDIMDNPQQYSTNTLYFSDEYNEMPELNSCIKNATDIMYIIINSNEELDIIYYFTRYISAFDHILAFNEGELKVGINIFDVNDPTDYDFGTWHNLSFNCLKSALPILTKTCAGIINTKSKT